jgi:PAS domain-containing protein
MQEKAAVFERFSRYSGPSGKRGLGTRWALILCVLALAASGQLSFAAETPARNAVLVLYSFTDRKPQDDLKYFGLVVLLFLVQAALIIGLLWQRARNRKADLRLRESEKRFRLMADTTPALIWMSDKEGTVTYLNDRLINFTGRDPATGLGDAWLALIHPDDVQSVQAANKRALEQRQEFSKE